MSFQYLDIYWRTLKMLRTNYEINLILTWAAIAYYLFSRWRKNCNNWYKFYVLVVTLLTKDNAKLLKQLDSGFNHIISCYKPLIKSIKAGTKLQFWFLNWSKFSRGFWDIFALLFKNLTTRTSQKNSNSISQLQKWQTIMLLSLTE